MHAVVDTNILVSGLLHPASQPGQVLQAIARCQITPVVCTAVMEEYRLVLPRPKLCLDAGDIAEALALIDRLAGWVTVPPYTGQPPLPDPTDWPFIACALAAGCPVITGNVKHFPAGVGVRVMGAREWVEGAAARPQP